MLAQETVVLALVVFLLVFLLRLYVVLRSGVRHKPGTKGSVSVLVVAGSGGHTTEILRLLGSLSSAYSPRFYVVAQSDRMSEDKIQALESSRQQQGDSEVLPHTACRGRTVTITHLRFSLFRIPRSREVHQSWSSSVLSTLNAVCHSIPLVFRLQPDLILCNGPGTCVPLCLAGLLLRVLGLKKVLLVFVESLCRVHTLSLTGRILYPVTDYFFVQWAPLRDKYPKAIFLGRIV